MGWFGKVSVVALIVVYGLVIIYHSQTIIGGRMVKLSHDDYIMGALNLHIYIILIFLWLLVCSK